MKIKRIIFHGSNQTPLNNITTHRVFLRLLSVLSIIYVDTKKKKKHTSNKKIPTRHACCNTREVQVFRLIAVEKNTRDRNI